MRIFIAIITAFSLPIFLAAQPTAIVFQAGESNYKCFRIPAIVQSPEGVLLAFAEGRVKDCGDYGDVDIVLKTSSDGGKSWGPLTVVASYDTLQCGNPAPVFDLLDPSFPKGRLFLFYNTGNASEWEIRKGVGQRQAFYTASSDGGLTWSPPVNISAEVHCPKPHLADWRTVANTPGHALQLENGRIFVAANHSANGELPAFRDYRAHAFFTDDHGKTFRLSPDVDYPGSNEAIAARVGSGVLMSVRNQSGDAKYRLLVRSNDGGETWDSVRIATDLPDPVCQGSILNFIQKNGEKALLHSNLASQTERCCLVLKISRDAGQTWETVREIYAGSAAYSDLVALKAGTVGILFECDDYTKIFFGKVEI